MKTCDVAGKIVTFDLEDWEFVNDITGWTVDTTARATYHYVRCTRGIYRRKMYSRVLMDCPEGTEVDHVNGNPLDNRKENLRIVTRSQNHMNAARQSGRTYDLPKGVTMNNGKYVARIGYNHGVKHLGTFDTVGKASTAYIIAADTHFGANAFHNRKHK
jgi:hypothetical protein